MLGNIWKVHDSSPWQNNFIDGIQVHNQSPWFKPMAIYSSKTQFLLAISKLNSYWQHQSPILIGTNLSNRKRTQDYQRLAKKKYYGKMLPWQKRTMAIILWKKKSLRVILRIMFSYYKLMKYMDIICITTSIIYTFNNHGKTFKPQAHHLNY